MKWRRERARAKKKRKRLQSSASAEQMSGAISGVTISDDTATPAAIPENEAPEESAHGRYKDETNADVSSTVANAAEESTRRTTTSVSGLERCCSTSVQYPSLV